MKVQEKELDQKVIDKLNQFENLKAGYSPDLGGIVCYNGTAFSTRYVNESFMRTVYKADEIAGMLKHLLRSDIDYMSAFDRQMIVGESKPSFFPSAAMESNADIVFVPDSKITKIKLSDDGFILALSEDGSVSKIEVSTGKLVSTVQAVTAIKDKFQRAVSDSNSISDFDSHGSGFLIATESDGVFYFDPTIDLYELKFQIPNVIGIKDLGDGKVAITVSDNRDGVIIGDFETGCKYASYDCLRRSGYQLPIAMQKIGYVGFAVLGRSYSPCQNGRILHVWKKDAAGAGLELLDPIMHPAKEDFAYQAKYLCNNGRYAWILGVMNGSPFVWEYNLDLPGQAPSEVIYDQYGISAEYDDLGFFSVYDNKFWFSIKDRIVAGNPDGTIGASIIAKEYDLSGMLMIKDSFYAISEGTVVKYSIPKLSSSHDVTMLISETPCNNIDVMVDGEGGEGLEFYDENDVIIEPTLHLVLQSSDKKETRHVIKMLQQSPSSQITLRLTVPEGNVIRGVVVHKNQLYMK
jgi:hypothetical protein